MTTEGVAGRVSFLRSLQEMVTNCVADNRSVFSCNSGGQRCESEVLAGLCQPPKALQEGPSFSLPVLDGGWLPWFVAESLQALLLSSHGLLPSVSSPFFSARPRIPVLDLRAHDNPGQSRPKILTSFHLRRCPSQYNRAQGLDFKSLQGQGVHFSVHCLGR